MDNDYKTKFVEPQQSVAVAEVEQPPDDELAAKALEEIHSTERLSGFGRFAMKLQNFFQASKSSQSKQGLSHLKAAPIMMSAGLLLLFATGLLFLLSKPESAVPSHFRQPTALAGSDGRKNAATAPTESPVTEDQLAGRDASNDARLTGSTSKKQGIENSPPRRFTVSDSERVDPNQPPQPGAQSRASALATPATVFVADSAADALLKKDIRMQSSPQPELQLPAGTEIVAHTTNAISSGLESPVVAVVDRSVKVGDTVVIPEGAHVIGHTAGAAKDRVNVRFTSVALPNDQQMAISGLALMKDGSAGLVGKVKGKGNPVLAGAARVGTGAAVVATEFAGQGSLNQSFSQGDYLRNQMAAEVASQGSQFSNRWQQPTSIPIVAVDANQPITIFILEPLIIAGKASRSAPPASQLTPATTTGGQTQPSEQDLVAAQTAYIQALEAQLAEMKAVSGKNPNEHQ
jgi:type IV secretory pathway VirB10-like protein